MCLLCATYALSADGFFMQTEIHIDASGAYYEVSSGADDGAPASTSTAAPSNKLHQAQISLNDCLACRCALGSFLSTVYF